MADARQIAKKLSPSMREGLLRQPCRSWWGDTPAAMPHSRQTGLALMTRGLAQMHRLEQSRVFPLTPLGESARAILLEEQK